MKRSLVLLWIVLTYCNVLNAQNTPSIDRVEHVIVIGFDGLSPDGLRHSKTPNFDKIISEGAYTFHARAVLPTSSSTNWATILMGAGPEQHGITSNSWQPDNYNFPPIIQRDKNLFPTIFNAVNEQIPNAEIGAVYQWEGFGRLFEKDAVDYDRNPENENKTAAVAGKYIEKEKPNFLFIHFDHIDHAGHQFGHGTKKYYEAVEKADKLLGQVMNSIKKAGIADETLVILCADHGGIGKSHGGESLQEIEVPLILWGAPIKENYEITEAVYQYDNATTVAFALGIRLPEATIGRAVKTAFKGSKKK